MRIRNFLEISNLAPIKGYKGGFPVCKLSRNPTHQIKCAENMCDCVAAALTRDLLSHDTQ